ncbi:MAG: type II secretion system protein N [Gammaproteobacteria bacterium]|nr:type II secretion system protein N [Gammaproteobacteria bacterium]
MFKLWRLTSFFLLCLVIAMLFNLPIQQVLPYIKLPDTVRAIGIDGTVIKGTAQEVSINNFPLREIRYRYMPSCIPLLKVCYKISYDRGDVKVAYDGLNGDTEVTGAQIEYQAIELAKYIPNALVKPAGRLELLIDNLSVVEGVPTVVNGKLIWRDLGVDDDDIKISVGDYQVDFTGDQKQYDFKINDLDADLDVSGKGEVRAGGQYEVDVKIGSETEIDPNVKSVLNLIAANAGYNQYRIEQQGKLPPNITRQLFR